jgi:hypothetical protein
VYPDANVLSPDGTVRGLPSSAWNAERLAQTNLCFCVTAFRREIWERVGGYRTNVRGYEDWDFWIAAASLGYRGLRIALPLFNYRVSATGVFASTPDHDLRLRATIVRNNPQWYSLVTHAVADAIVQESSFDPMHEWEGIDEILQTGLMTAAQRSAAGLSAWAERCARRGVLPVVQQRLQDQLNSNRINAAGLKRLGALYRQSGRSADGDAILLVALGTEMKQRAAKATPGAEAPPMANAQASPSRAPRVLCWMPYGQWALHGQHEMTILHGAQRQGAEIRYVMCDGAFRACDMHWEVVRPRTATSCAECRHLQSRYASGLRMPHEWISAHLTSEERETASSWAVSLPTDALLGARYADLEIGAWVVSSVHSQFRSNRVDLHDAAHEASMRAHLEAGLLVAFATQRLLRDWAPDVMLLFNGRMGVLRAAFEVARAAGVRVITHERGWIAGTLYLAENAHCLSLTPLQEAWARWRDQPLLADEHAQLETWLLDRANGRNLNWLMFSPPPGAEDAVRKSLALRPDAPLFVVFTSSEDEVAGNDDFVSVFGGQQEWLEATAEWAARNPDVDVVVRVHPNTGGRRSMGRNAEQIDWLRRFAVGLSANVHVVWPDDAVSSYTLIEMATATLSYLSTMGMEAACRGRRAFMAASAFVGGHGFTDEIDDPAHYSALLDRYRIAEEPDVVLRRRVMAWRFAYMALYRYMLPFPLVVQRDVTTAYLAYTTLDALKPGSDPALDRAVDMLLRGTPICPDPDPAVQRDATAEAARHLATITFADSSGDIFTAIAPGSDDRSVAENVETVRTAVA